MSSDVKNITDESNILKIENSTNGAQIQSLNWMIKNNNKTISIAIDAIKLQ